MTTTLLVPTRNELEPMRVIMPQVRPEWCQQILVIDASTDGTADYARAQGYDVLVQRQAGIRFAYNEAFPQVRGDIVITFSPDGNSIPDAIPRLIEKMNEGYDMVIASRYLPPAHSDDDDWMTGFGNWLYTRTINSLHGGHYTDAMVIFRAYRTRLFYDLGLDNADAYRPEKWFGTVLGVEPLLSVRAAKRKLKVTEIPADEPPRIGGQRKLQPFRWGAAYMAQIWRELYFWR